jgi:hypothetical protein
MRDLTIGKTMDAHRHHKHRERKGIPPLLICWLIAVGIMILVSSTSKALPEPAVRAANASARAADASLHTINASAPLTDSRLVIR